MTFLTRLDVVNEMLGTLGEAPLNAEEPDHPFYIKASRTLDIASYRVQGRGWWFNEELVQLAPDASSRFIYLPNDTIRVDPREPYLEYVQRGRRLYAPFLPPSKDKFRFDHAVTCWLLRHVPFEELPVIAQMAVSYAAQVSFQSDIDGDSERYKKLVAEARSTLLDLNAEHMRNRSVNMLDTPSVQAALNRISAGGGLRIR